MSFHLALQANQISGFATIREADRSELQRVSSELKSYTSIIVSLADLRNALAEILPEDADLGEALFRHLLPLYNLRRHRHLTSSELVEGISKGLRMAIKCNWTDTEFERWEERREDLESLFSIENISVVAKSVDLAFDYANLFQAARIITDIRPVFSDDGQTILASVVSSTLRLSYDNREAEQSLSLAMDETDIQFLKEECERALVKLQTSKLLMENDANKPTLIIGEAE